MHRNCYCTIEQKKFRSIKIFLLKTFFKDIELVFLFLLSFFKLSFTFFNTIIYLKNVLFLNLFNLCPLLICLLQIPSIKDSIMINLDVESLIQVGS